MPIAASTFTCVTLRSRIVGSSRLSLVAKLRRKQAVSLTGASGLTADVPPEHEVKPYQMNRGRSEIAQQEHGEFLCRRRAAKAARRPRGRSRARPSRGPCAADRHFWTETKIGNLQLLPMFLVIVSSSCADLSRQPFCGPSRVRNIRH